MSELFEEYKDWLREKQVDEALDWKKLGRHTAISAAAAATGISAFLGVAPPAKDLHQTLRATSQMETQAEKNAFIRKRGHQTHLYYTSDHQYFFNQLHPEGWDWHDRNRGHHLSSRLRDRVSNTKGATEEEVRKRFEKEMLDKIQREREDHDRIHGKGAYDKMKQKQYEDWHNRQRHRI